MRHRFGFRFSRWIRAVFSLLLLGVLPSAAQALELLADPAGYHPAAPKRVQLLSVPTYEKLPIGVQLFDIKHVDPIRHRPRLIYRTAVRQRQADGSAWLDLREFTQIGEFQLKVGNLPPLEPHIRINPGRYWDGQGAAVKQLDSLKTPPAQGADRLCASTDDSMPVTPRPDLGWLSQPRQKQTAENALATWYLLSWYQANPLLQESLHLPTKKMELESGDFWGMPELLGISALELRWLLSLQTSARTSLAGLWWPAGHSCYHTVAVTSKASLASAAAFAKAAQVYKKRDLGFAVKNLVTAEDLWEHQNPADWQDPALREWAVLAATELWLATRKPVYMKAILNGLNGWTPGPVQEEHPAALALWDLLRLDTTLDGRLTTILHQALSQPLPELAHWDGLTQRMLVGLSDNQLTIIDQVAVALPHVNSPKTLLEQAQAIWINGMLNEVYNHQSDVERDRAKHG